MYSPTAFRNFLVSGQYHAYALITMRERGKGSKWQRQRQ